MNQAVVEQSFKILEKYWEDQWLISEAHKRAKEAHK